MDYSEAQLDNTEAQRSTDVSQEQPKRRYPFPMNLIRKGARALGSQSRGDGSLPPTEDTESMPEFLINLRWSNLYHHPGVYVKMDAETYSAMRVGDIIFLEKLKTFETPMECFKDDAGDSILHVAASFGHLELVEGIISECPSLLLEPNGMDQIPLHVAARAGHSTVVQALVASATWFSTKLSEEGRDSHNVYVMKDLDGNTPLHLALKYVHVHGKREHHISKSSFSDTLTRLMKIVVSLVDACQHAVYLANDDGISPLFLAVEAGNVSILNGMLNPRCNNDNGRIYNLASQLEGRRSLAHAALEAKNADILDVILRKEPSLVNELDEEGQTCLSVGVSVGYYEGVCYLLERSITGVFSRDDDGYFPIHMAAKYGHVQILKEILERCPNALELLSRNGETILHVAARNGQVKAIRFILRLYKDGNKEHFINAQDVLGNTMLHLATIQAHAKAVTMLTWDKRLDLKAVNRDGVTALDIAVMRMSSSGTLLEVLTWIPLVSAGAPRGSHSGITTHGHGASTELVNTLLLVSTLVATMTFTAGFALPGGYNESVPNLGLAALAKKTAFRVFLVFDTLAIYFSIITTVALIWAQLGNPSLVKKALNLALPLLGLSLTFMSIAFMAGTFAAVTHLPSLAYSILGIGLIFLVFYLLILIPFVSPTASSNPILRHIFYFPHFLLLWAVGDNTDN